MNLFKDEFSLGFIILIITSTRIPAVIHGRSSSSSGGGYGLKRPSTTSNSSVAAIYVFGDSTVDPGNNNYIKTISKCDFPPYGIDLENHIPTGRFCNGRLATDFLASYIGIKDYIPPYLDPTLRLDDLTTGVSFASGGSGYDLLTYTENVAISMSKQFEYFTEYKSRLQRSIGKTRMKDIIANSVFVISAGTNDLIQSRGQTKTSLEYRIRLLNMGKSFLQGLLAQGARKILVVGAPPIGCLPNVITLSNMLNNPFGPRECIDSLNAISIDYNKMLKEELKNLSESLNNPEIIYADIYDSIYDQIRHPEKYGFEITNRGCCGTGLVEESILCNRHSDLCSDRTKYVFWDAIHPTQRTYYNCFRAVRPLCDILAKD